MSRFEDNFILWFTILSLVFTGVVLQNFLNGMNIPAVISFISSLATIFGFMLAVKAYNYWRHKDTESEQAKLVREIMMFVAELELNLELSFNSCILEELDNRVTIYPPLDQRVKLSKVKELTDNINMLMVKFYAIEPNPPSYLLNVSKLELLSGCHKNDPFESLKQYLCKVDALLTYTKGDNTLSCNNNVLSSPLPDTEILNVSIMYNGANSFVKLSLFFSDATRAVERDLRVHIK